MKILYGLLVISMAAIVISVAAARLRLHLHLRRPGRVPEPTPAAAPPQHEPVEKS
jgi:hypothetical protein